MAHIDYYFSTFSPFTFFAGLRMEAIAEKHGATVTYKPLDLMALFARTGGTPPKDRHPSRIEYRAQELRRQAKKLGITINPMPPGYPPNPAPSSYALIAAQKAGGGSLGDLVQAYCRMRASTGLKHALVLVGGPKHRFEKFIEEGTAGDQTRAR